MPYIERKTTHEDGTTVTEKHYTSTKQHPKLVQQICNNFKTGDIVITLSFAKSGEEIGEADRIKQIDEFIRKLRKSYKAAGKEVKYAAVLIHNLYVSDKIDRVNLIANGIGDVTKMEELVQGCWQYGTCRLSSIKTHESIREIAEYTERIRTGKYRISKNIAKVGR